MLRQFALLTVPLALGAWSLSGCESTEPRTGSRAMVGGSSGEPLPASLKKAMLPAWETREEQELSRLFPEQRVSRRTAPPAGELQVPPEFARMDGVLVRIPVGSEELGHLELASFYAKMVKGFLAAGAWPIVLAADQGEEQTLLDDVFTPNGISAEDIAFVRATSNTLWARDYGPWHVYVDGARAIVDQRYYRNRAYDDRIPQVLGDAWEEPVYSTVLYTEGGNFMTDGLGTCFASQGVLRNNSLGKVKIEGIYRDYLGCKAVYFVPPLAGEGTTHVDMFSKILDQDTILVASSTAALGATGREIESLERAAAFYRITPKPDGGAWNIVRIPMTFHSLSYDDGTEERVFNAHTNSLIVNDHVLVPTYGRGTDAAALSVYRKAMPGYRVVGVDSRVIIPFGGSVHCSTMQIPARDQGACGDGLVSGSEECEPRNLLGQTCQTLGYRSGTLTCNDSCQLDTSRCK